MNRERVLVTVLSYPVLSKKHGEVVCTAGIRADGSWVRIYPVPLDEFGGKLSYRKYDWLEVNLVKRRKDRRPESHSLVDLKDIEVIDHCGTEDNWRQRRELVLHASKVYTQFKPLIEGAKRNTVSLAVFKPKRILDFTWQACDQKLDPQKVEAVSLKADQGLLGDEHWQDPTFIRPLPYRFSYRFSDWNGEVKSMPVLEWELGDLFWQVNTEEARKSFVPVQVRKRYLDEYSRTDLHFFLGTTHRFKHWVIVGVFPVPHVSGLKGI